MPKIIQHDVGQAFITGVTLRQHWPVNSHSLSFGAETAILCVAVIGLLTTEQTRVHLSHDLVGDQLARHHCFHFLLAFFGVVDIGLLIIEQTRVHLGHDHEHVHGGIHAQLVGQQPAQLWASPHLVHSGLARGRKNIFWLVTKHSWDEIGCEIFWMEGTQMRGFWGKTSWCYVTNCSQIKQFISQRYLTNLW